MKMKMFAFNKLERSPNNIQTAINTFIENKAFKWASHSESYTRGKFFMSIFYEEGKKSNIQCSVFKNTDEKKVEEIVNEFLSDKTIEMKLATQTSVSSHMYLILFYESKKVKDDTSDQEQKK